MAYMVSVVVHYDIDGIGVSRSTELHIESEEPITTAEIDQEVAGLADELIRTPGSPDVLKPGQTYTYTWSLESVFEF